MWAEGQDFSQGKILDAIVSALAAAGLSGVADGEALLKRSAGSGLRLRTGAAPERSRWSELGLAIRIVHEDGRSSLVASSYWQAPELAAAEAVRLVQAGSTHAPRSAPLADSEPFAGERGGYLEGALRAPSGNELEAALHELERAARETDQRVIALDRAMVRGALIDSVLVTTKGASCSQRQPLVQAQASVLAREGLRVSSAAESWAGASLDGLAGLGQRLGRKALLQLLGVSTLPAGAPVLLSREAVAELTFVLAPLLLGLAGDLGASECEQLELHPGLTLREDAVRDGLARSAPQDGVGLSLRELHVVRDGRLSIPGALALPNVRASLADTPLRGWNRLSWRFSEGASTQAELLERMGTGFFIEDLRPLSLSADGRSFTGLAAGQWLEEGRLRHAVAGVPFEIEALDFLARIQGGGAEPSSCHSSGSVRAVPLLLSPQPG